VHEGTGQRLLDAHGLDLNARPNEMFINNQGQLELHWSENNGTHKTTFDASWYVITKMYL
jgi:hypothetical protein